MECAQNSLVYSENGGDAPARLVLAATGSGRGKTTIVSALLALLARKHTDVRAFKCGPDYIDPMFHETMIGVPSKNLDPFFCGEELLKASFWEDHGEINIIEGVMGLYDGIGMTGKSSTYETACMLKAPIVLCIDARGMGRSILAEIKGFLSMDEESLIRGVFLNRVSEGDFAKLAPWLEEELGIPVVGFLPRMPESALSSRHLGLVMPEENEALAKLAAAADMLEKTLDLDKLLGVAGGAGPLGLGRTFADMFPASGKKAVIAVAKDEAFCFSYRDNITALELAGAEIRYFSPVHDMGLPEGTCGILLVGGYPELYAAELSANTSMRASVLEACRSGMPVLAECGGFMYLQQQICDENGTHDMVGLFEGQATRKGRLIRFGYIESTGPETVMRGHEFHHYDVDDPGDAWTLKRENSGETYPAMRHLDHVTAGFPHYYYFSDFDFARRFVADAAEYGRASVDGSPDHEGNDRGASEHGCGPDASNGKAGETDG